MNIPNFLTSIRFVLIGIFTYFILGAGNYTAALVVFLLAVFTDWLDGFIARKFNMITNAGKLLDPLADKLMLIAALLCFVIKGWVSPVILAIAAAKELLMIAGGIYLYKKKIVVYADKFGKVATFCFNCGIGLTILGNFVNVYYSNIIMLWLALALGIVAFVHYARTNMGKPKSNGSGESPQS